MSLQIPANVSPPSDSGSDSASDDGGCSDWASSFGEARRTQALFDDSVHDSPEAALAADRAAHGFDLGATADRLGLDLYGRMRLINWIRRERPTAAEVATLSRDDPRLKDDALLLPVIPDDPMLQLDFDDSWSDDDNDESAAGGDKLAPVVEDEIAKLRAEVAALRTVVNRTLNEGEEPEAKKRDDDTSYFDSYAANDIHELMLKDTTRTVSYARFILSNPSVFKDAIVMDVGAGTGILSMLAARAGAKHVYAIEASGLATKTRDNIRANGLQDTITVIQGKVEHITLPIDTKVDVIISEWMGYMLLYESMLDSVLVARDRFLAPTGLMAPSQTRLVISAITGARLWRERIDFWKNVYGFDMHGAMIAPYFAEGIVEIIDHDEVVTSECIVRDINTHDATVASLEFRSDFTITSNSNDSTTVRAFLTHFDTFFSPLAGASASHVPPSHPVHIQRFTDDMVAQPVEPVNTAEANAVSFTTGARGQPTHWKQVAFLLREPITLGSGQSIIGRFHCRKADDYSRGLEVEIHFAVVSGAEKPTSYTVQTYKVN